MLAPSRTVFAVFVALRLRGRHRRSRRRRAGDHRSHRPDAVAPARGGAGPGYRHQVGCAIDSRPVQHQLHARSGSEPARARRSSRWRGDHGAAAFARRLERIRPRSSTCKSSDHDQPRLRGFDMINELTFRTARPSPPSLHPIRHAHRGRDLRTMATLSTETPTRTFQCDYDHCRR